MNSIQEKSKHLVCLSLIRNSLNAGNDRVKKVISETKLNKAKTFDKIIVLMLDNCLNNITQEEIQRLLTPENILSINDELNNLINFDNKIFYDPLYEITFTDREFQQLEEIFEATLKTK